MPKDAMLHNLRASLMYLDYFEMKGSVSFFRDHNHIVHHLNIMLGMRIAMLG